MSSSPPADQAGANGSSGQPYRRTRHRHAARTGHRWPNTHSLRVRILGVLVGLLALMFVFVGTTTVFTLNYYLVKQLDGRLTQADQQFRNHPPGALGSDQSSTGGYPDPTQPYRGSTTTPNSSTLNPNTGGGLFQGVQGPDTLQAQIIDGKVKDAKVLSGSGPTAIPTSQYSVLTTLPVDNKPRTRDLGTLGSYRLVAHQEPSGSTLVIGLPMADVNTALRLLVGIEIAVGLMALIIATFGGAAIIRVALAPLTRVAATARRISELPLHEGEVGELDRVPHWDTDPRSEVGQVGAALNRMLGHIGSALAARQASETRLRRFVADASHELRTPLAAIRGYTELTRRDRAATPPQVSAALDRVEAAAGRMTTLVEDLLLLARLDAKRPLTREPVDLSAMVIEAVTDAHVAGPEHRWRLDLPEESVGTIGDAARLHQVLANLLANARTHTPPGTTVTVGLTTCPGHVAVRVTDNGPGIPTELLPRLFERFARGDTSRSRSTGSTGLGLAIVDAVVAAHDGSVEVTSVPGETVFVVWLPSDGDSQLISSNGTHHEQQQGTLLTT